MLRHKVLFTNMCFMSKCSVKVIENCNSPCTISTIHKSGRMVVENFKGFAEKNELILLCVCVCVCVYIILRQIKKIYL
jgi:hypothetical protein